MKLSLSWTTLSALALLNISGASSQSQPLKTSQLNDLRSLQPRVGHGIVPNLSPGLAPAMRSENSVEMKDLFNFDLLTGDAKLPNTWDSLPSYRYPYYDNQGLGYLLYGYGGLELYNYSEFDRMEGYF